MVLVLTEILILFEEHERNREWFEKNYDALVDIYDGKFIAIYKQAVIDSDEDVGRLVENVEKKYPLDSVSIQYVSKEKLQLIL